MEDQVMVPLETVTAIANYVWRHPHAQIMDIMAEFDLTNDEAFFALATARLVIRDMEKDKGRGR